MATAQKTPDASDAECFISILIHPDLRWGMRSAAAAERIDMKEWLHRLLCRELGRTDLLNKVPKRQRA